MVRIFSVSSSALFGFQAMVLFVLRRHPEPVLSEVEWTKDHRICDGTDAKRIASINGVCLAYAVALNSGVLPHSTALRVQDDGEKQATAQALIWRNDLVCGEHRDVIPDIGV